MDRIDFDATIENGGIIRVPDEYVKELTSNGKVHVSVSNKRLDRATVKRMREHPVHVPVDMKPMSRDEIYRDR